MRLMVTILLIVVFASCSGQQGLTNKEWYVLWDDGLMRYRFTGDSILTESTGFAYEPTGKKSGKVRIANTYRRNDLYCFVERDDSIGGAAVFRATVVREPGNGSVMELLMNCAADDFSDSAEIAHAFFVCDTSKAMVIRLYDRNTVESFRKLKNIKDLTPTDHIKIFDLYKAAGVELNKKYKSQELWLISPFLRRQQLTDVLVAVGYNPLIDSQRMEKLGLSIYN